MVQGSEKKWLEIGFKESSSTYRQSLTLWLWLTLFIHATSILSIDSRPGDGLAGA